MRLPRFNDVHQIELDKCEPKKMVNIYLMTSYLYYHLNESVITDDEFDYVCKVLYKHYDQIDHPHLYLIDKDQLMAGTGFYIPETNYPNIVKGGARLWLKDSLSRLGRYGDRKVKKSQKEFVRKRIIANNLSEVNYCVANAGLKDASLRSLEVINPRTVIAEVDCLES
jgi:hypothetical protein